MAKIIQKSSPSKQDDPAPGRVRYPLAALQNGVFTDREGRLYELVEQHRGVFILTEISKKDQ